MRLTKDQGVVLTGFTGLLMCEFSDFHEDVEKRVGRPVWSHEFGDKEFSASLKELYKEDFINMMPDRGNE